MFSYMFIWIKFHFNLRGVIDRVLTEGLAEAVRRIAGSN